MPKEIIPGLNEQEWGEIEHKFDIIRPFAKTVHIDIIDGTFTSNKTFLDPEPFKKYSQDFFLEAHLMVTNPLTYLEPFAKAGFRRFLGHIEHMPDQVEFLAKGEELGEVGLALDGPTPLSALTVSLEDVDSLLVFTARNVGPSGQPFMEERLDKVSQIHTLQPLLPITVDGGITHEAMSMSLRAGVSRFVVTSALFKSDDPEKAYRVLHETVTTFVEE